LQYLTPPEHVRSDHIEQAWLGANRRLESRFAVDPATTVKE
jgi:hypothetical protein